MSSQWQSPWNAAERKAARKMLMSMLRTALWLQDLSMSLHLHTSLLPPSRDMKIGKASISRAATALAIPLSCLVTCRDQEVAACESLVFICPATFEQDLCRRGDFLLRIWGLCSPRSTCCLLPGCSRCKDSTVPATSCQEG